MPYSLNKKYFILIGKKKKNNTFILEYIAIYNNEFDLKIHLNEITKNLNQYLNKKKIKNNSAPLIIGNKQKIGGTIIKYKNDDGNSSEKKKELKTNKSKKEFENLENKKELNINKNKNEFEKNKIEKEFKSYENKKEF